MRFLLCLLLPAAVAAQDPALARRREALDVLLKVLPPSRTRITGRINTVDRSWEDWVRRTGELPPDFQSMPSIPDLPDPLAGVETREQWTERRRAIRAQFERWFFGTMPPKPDNLRAVVTGTRKEGEVKVRDVRLEFGPGHRATLRVQLMIPPGPGPLPVFLTNHPRTRPWVATAVRRGYIGCIYFAADPIYGNEDDSDKFIEVYPEHDFSCLARWAWAAMRAVDYLYTLPEVDKNKIGITGHSRNGKQALLAAAFDERIGAAVPSSGNTGEGDPWRYTTDLFANESIEQITGAFPHWFHPRLRFFAGREHKLPVDQNSLMALVAPRGLLLASAFSETQGNSFGFEQAFRSVRQVYRFLGREENAGLYLRAGEHPTTAGDIEVFVDFFDAVFGRKPLAKPETWVNGYSFEQWKGISGETRPPPAPAGIPERIRWALGEEPPGVRFPARRELKGAGMTSDGWLSVLYNRPLKNDGMGSAPLAFGDDLRGDLYFPADAGGRPQGGKWPVVVWLHAFSYPTGYSRYARPTFASLTRRGFAVLAFDQIGFGTRVEHARNFYRRYPRWSLLGKMVTDTRAALDALAALEAIDASRIYLVGYGLGAKVALFTAALDGRPRAVASVCGFTALRAAGSDKGLEGIRQYSHLHGLIPRFGFFAGNEAGLPLDYDEVLAAIAPRPVLVVAPTLDRYAPVEDVKRAIGQARAAWSAKGRGSALRLDTPVDFNRFPTARQEEVFDWLEAQR
jgi:dienelactone hydrolase